MVGGLNSFPPPSTTQRAFVLFVRVFKCDDLQQYALSSFLRRHIGALTALDGILGGLGSIHQSPTDVERWIKRDAGGRVCNESRPMMDEWSNGRKGL